MKRHRAVRRRKPWDGRGPGKPPFPTEVYNLEWVQSRHDMSMCMRRIVMRGKRLITDCVVVREHELCEFIERDDLDDHISILMQMSDAYIEDVMLCHKARVRARRIARYLKACASRKHVRLGLICSE